jgi:hypothetical protein
MIHHVNLPAGRWFTSVVVVLALFGSGGESAVLATGVQEKQGTPEQIEFFEKRIRPLLANHCYQCHSKDAKKVRGGLLLDTREGTRKGGELGPALIPGQPDKSLLIKAVRYDQDLRMPPKGKLSPGEITDLETWIKMGAPDPRDGNVTAVTKKTSTIDIEAGKQFWAFRPVQKPALPTVKNTSWPLSPVDRLVLARLEEKGLRPVEPADKLTLLRRATFDLTGLPPTPEEIDAFLKDDSPDAFAKVVERLLASPAYGERWGRHWLDVVRYSDTAGDNSDYPIPQMYKYRNWVIDAFNKDMPYDQFVREQLAGDLMAATSDKDRQEKIIATGYLANSRRHGSYEDERYPWHLTIEDTIDNFGKAFLGVTMGCARCHDHKFDPLLAEDYYALYGFFSSTRYPWPGIELDRVQRDLVPLAPADEVARVMKERQAKLSKLETAVKKLEAEKAPQDKIKAAKKGRDDFAKQPLPYATAYAMKDGPAEPKKRIGQVGDVHIQLKGNPDHPGAKVSRHFPLVLGGQTLPTGTKGSGRLELAHWLTDTANPLFARVMVNRIWQYHFGAGLVATPNNFGKQGQPPTHPELLDYLAQYFIDHGWSVKDMHRLIMLSRVYQLSSRDDEANLKIDVNNAYLWRFARYRLDAESIRDAILAVSGSLDRGPGGEHPFPAQTSWNFTQHRPFKAVYDTNQRSVYLMTQRIQKHPFLALFDGPDTNTSTADRPITTTPLQALFLMNNPFVHENARKLAARLLAEKKNDSERIDYAYRLTFGRPPTGEELDQARNYLAQVSQKLQSGLSQDQRNVRAWESLARVLYMSNEFVYVN